jgi:hypothetical protein
MNVCDEVAIATIESEPQRELKFSLSRETVAELGSEEDQDEDGPASSFSCCIGCNTDGSASFCIGKTGC